MSQQFEKTVFGNKKFSDLLEEIYNNQKRREAQVTALISELKPMVSDIGDATLIVPLIKEYMEIGVKNDDALIKMATLVQRALNSTSEDGGLGISDEEKAQLLEEMEGWKTIRQVGADYGMEIKESEKTIYTTIPIYVIM